MRWTTVAAMLLASILVSGAIAQGQVWLNVDDCDGAQTASWACDTETGAALKVMASVIAPQLLELDGQVSWLRVRFAEPVPAWWKLGSGQCRAIDSITLDLGAAPSACVSRMADAPMAVQGGMYYRVGPLADGWHDQLDDREVEIEVISALERVIQIDPWVPVSGQSFGLFTLTIDRRNTVGPGACDGCSACAWLWLRHVWLVQPIGVGDVHLDGGDFFSSSVTVQGMQLFTSGPSCPTTPTNRSTWGQVKSLYR